MKFLLSYIYWQDCYLVREINVWLGGESTGGIFPGGGMSQFLASRKTPPIPSSRENPAILVPTVSLAIQKRFEMVIKFCL